MVKPRGYACWNEIACAVIAEKELAKASKEVGKNIAFRWVRERMISGAPN
jgi:hypothetical protein